MRPRLQVNLAAIAANYRLLKQQAPNSVCGAVVKADGYGLGAAQVSRALFDREGCRTYFVAYPEEGAAVRTVLPDKDVTIYILHGYSRPLQQLYMAHRLTPIINTAQQWEHWWTDTRGTASQDTLAPALQIDTGMSRVGMSQKELERTILSPNGARPISLIMSHMACGDDPQHPLNQHQLNTFERVSSDVAGVLDSNTAIPHSLAASSAIFLGPEFHFDMIRPGIALYGGNPTPYAERNPMQPVMRLMAQITQLRQLHKGDLVGYGGTFEATGGETIAALNVGYADGYFRILSNKGYVSVNGHAAPVVGRVSMDLLLVDMTEALSKTTVEEGQYVEVAGVDYDINELADNAQTISYEFLTRLGSRCQRSYEQELWNH